MIRLRGEKLMVGAIGEKAVNVLHVDICVPLHGQGEERRVSVCPEYAAELFVEAPRHRVVD